MSKKLVNLQANPNRRSFLKAGAFSTGALVFGGLRSATALGANDRIGIGVIGVGGMGSGHLRNLIDRKVADNLEVPAVCDVYRKRVRGAQAVCQGEGYMDYRRLLEKPDIDAVLIATPDHWHSKITIDALEAGKHVYCEKPMTHTVEQAIATRDAARNSSKIVQIGPNATGNDSFWKAHQAIQDGRIGKATWAHGSYNRNQRNCAFNFPIDPKAGPDGEGDDYIDWNMWLGHQWNLAPKIPFNPNHFFQFRKYFPYNGGVATDLLYHKLAPLLIAMSGPNGEYPLRVNGNGGLYVEKDGRDIPDVFMMTVDYPSEWSLFLVSVLTNTEGLPDRIYGKHGTMELGGEPYLRFNGDFKREFTEKNDGKEEIRLPVEPRRDMVGNWLDVIRGKGRLFCNAELGTSTMVAIKMAVESYRQSRTLLWDAKKERVVTA